MEQANDFLEESRQIYELLLGRPQEDFRKPTLFKGWTVNDVIGHLHIFNFAAECSLKGAEDFENFFVFAFLPSACMHVLCTRMFFFIKKM